MTLLGGAASAMRTGRSCTTGAASCTAAASRGSRDEPRPFPYQVDGDDLGDATPAHFTYEPDVLTVVLP